MTALRSIAIAPIRLYQRALSPALPSRCKYHPSCSQYAVEAVRTYGILRGIVLAGWRLLRCNPWSHGGVDFVQDQTLFSPRGLGGTQPDSLIGRAPDQS
ncbi:MAG: membrane protein insertion efficiency factor YidD [Thermoleophilaceae bacterium]